MKELFKNIKETLAKLFGFEEIKEVQDWKEYLDCLEKTGYFTPDKIKAFKESEKFADRLAERT